MAPKQHTHTPPLWASARGIDNGSGQWWLMTGTGTDSEAEMMTTATSTPLLQAAGRNDEKEVEPCWQNHRMGQDDTNTNNKGADNDDNGDQGTAMMKAWQTRMMGTGWLAQPSTHCCHCEQLLTGWRGVGKDSRGRGGGKWNRYSNHHIWHNNGGGWHPPHAYEHLLVVWIVSIYGDGTTRGTTQQQGGMTTTPANDWNNDTGCINMRGKVALMLLFGHPSST